MHDRYDEFCSNCETLSRLCNKRDNNGASARGRLIRGLYDAKYVWLIVLESFSSDESCVYTFGHERNLSDKMKCSNMHPMNYFAKGVICKIHNRSVIRCVKRSLESKFNYSTIT